MNKDLQRFITRFSTELSEGTAAAFIGAGFSIPAGYSSWKDLLREIAEELELDITVESDLIALAQYHVNERGNRSGINRTLVEEFARLAKVTENHRLLARLPIHTIWTTNYDTTIEEAYREIYKRLDVKIKVDHLALTLPGRDAVLYKMHGDKGDPTEAILTKDDYETFESKRGIFTEMLKGDLLSKTFLFLGFSFTDPNIDHVLSRIRVLLGRNPREHYCIIKRPDKPKEEGAATAQYEYECRKLQLRVDDLKRYSIRTLLIDDFAEITELLRALNYDAHKRCIFVSGSAHDYEPLGRERIEKLSRRIGSEIIDRGYNLTSGFGLGIGAAIVLGAMESLQATPDGKANDRLTLRPFPQKPPEGMTLKEYWTAYRRDMIGITGFSIFLCGNKLDEATGQVVPANGVREEFQIMKESGKYPIPVGATGHVAREIWEELMRNPEAYYPSVGVADHIAILGRPDATDDQIIEAIFAIADRTLGK